TARARDEQEGSGGGVLLQERDGVADGENRLCGVIRDLAAEFLLEGHDQLDCVEAVGPKIVNEARTVGDLVGLDAEMLNHDLLYALRDIAHVRLTVSFFILRPRTSPGLGSRPNVPQSGKFTGFEREEDCLCQAPLEPHRAAVWVTYFSGLCQKARSWPMPPARAIEITPSSLCRKTLKP